MKTTVEIPNGLLADARRVARREQTTVRALIEEGLRKVLLAREQQADFRLRKVSFRGEGLAAGDASWERIRELAYEGRGG